MAKSSDTKRKKWWEEKRGRGREGENETEKEKKKQCKTLTKAKPFTKQSPTASGSINCLDFLLNVSLNDLLQIDYDQLFDNQFGVFFSIPHASAIQIAYQFSNCNAVRIRVNFKLVKCLIYFYDIETITTTNHKKYDYTNHFHTRNAYKITWTGQNLLISGAVLSKSALPRQAESKHHESSEQEWENGTDRV